MEMDKLGVLTSFIHNIVVYNIPLLYGTVGEIVVEKSGSLNLGVEGIMAVGAIFGYICGCYANSLAVGILAPLFLCFTLFGVKEHREDALREIYFEMERLRNELVDEGELQMVKNVMIGEILRILDGPFGIADVTIENIMCGMDNSATEESVARIFAITAEEIKALAEKYLRREDLIEVYAG